MCVRGSEVTGSVLLVRLGDMAVIDGTCSGGRKVTLVVLCLALARRQVAGGVHWWKDAVGGSLWRRESYRGTCVHGSLTAALCLVARIGRENSQLVLVGHEQTTAVIW